MEFKLRAAAILVLLAMIQNSGAQDIAECIVTDFAAGEIMYAYSGSVATGSRPSDPVIKVTVGTNTDVSPLYAISMNSASSESNREQECWPDLKLCRATLGMLQLAAVRQYLFGSSEAVATGSNPNRLRIAAGEGGTFQDCYVVGRRLKFMNDSIYSSNSLTDASYEFNAGGITGEGNFFGVTQRPTSVNFYESGVNLVGVQLTYTGSASENANFGQVSGTAASSGSFNPLDVQEVTVYYTNLSGTNVGSTCGLEIVHTPVGGTTTTISGGCTTNPVVFTISSGYAFAGLVGYTDGTGVNFVLQPLEYQRMQPMIYYYARTHNSVTLHVNSFWPLSSSLSYSYSRTNGISSPSGLTTTSTSSSGSAGNNGNTGEIAVGPIDTVCGCVDVDVTITNEYSDDGTWEYASGNSDSITAWSYGYQNMGSESTSTTPTTTTYTTPSQYWVGSVADECPEKYMRSYLPNLEGGQFFIDGLLGESTGALAAKSDTDFTPITQAINTIMVYFSANNVAGIQLGWDGQMTYSIGDTNLLSPDTLEAPAETYFMTLSINDLSGGGQSLSATYGQAIGPCFVVNAPVPDVANNWINGGSFFDINSDNDADQYQFWLYLPADYDEIRADISGYFLVDNENYGLTLAPPTGSGGFSRATVVHAKLYHLQAERDYTIEFWGEFYDVTGLTGVNLTSQRTTDTFTSPNGVRYYCEADGDSYEQIEFESLPDVEILFEQTAEATQLQSTVTSMQMTPTDPSSQSFFFPNTDFFHYEANDNNYPKYDGFSGYPHEAKMYQSSTGDTCLSGVALGYKGADGSVYYQWVAGNAVGSGNANNEFTIEIDQRATAVYGLVGSQNSFNCLAALQFDYGNNQFSACDGIGVISNSCSNRVLLFNNTGLDPNSYLSSFSGASDGNGNFVVRLSGNYAAVDLPSLQSSSSCVLTNIPDWDYIRNSVWWRSVDFDQSSGSTDFTNCNIDRNMYRAGVNENPAHPDQYDPDTPDDDYEITYHQRVVRNRDFTSNPIQDSNGGGLSIVRQSAWEVNLFCYYDATGEVSSNYSTIAEEGKTVAGKNEFSFALTIYKDSSFTNSYSVSEVPVMLLNEPVYMAASMVNPTGPQNNFFVRAFECWATQGAAATTNTPQGDYYSLSQSDGCSADSTFSWDSTATTVQMDAFRFDAFAWYDTTTQQLIQTPIYVQCRVRACLNGDTQFCVRANETNACGNKRARRDAATLGHGEHFEESIITAPTPIIIREKRGAVEPLSIARGPIHMQQQPLEGARMAAGMFSLFATTMLLSMLVVVYKAYKLRHNYYAVKGYMNRDTTSNTNNHN